MPRTLLQMVQAAQAELGLPQATTVFGSAAQNTDIQMGALANRALDELRRMNRWTALQWEFDLSVSVPFTLAGNMVAGSAIITGLSSTAAITAQAFSLSGTGIPPAARVQSVDSATQVTMTMPNTNTTNLTATNILFMQDTYNMPDGFDWFNNRTMWDRTNRWELLGPESPQEDQWRRSGIVTTGPRRRFRKIGPYAKSFRIWPAPAELTAPLALVFEYLSINAVAVSGSATSFAQYFVNDDDTCLLDEQAIIMGIKWMFWEAKGFGSYVTLQSRWVDYVERLIARDGAAPTLNMAKRVSPLLISPANIPDGYFPGSTN